MHAARTRIAEKVARERFFQSSMHKNCSPVINFCPTEQSRSAPEHPAPARVTQEAARSRAALPVIDAQTCPTAGASGVDRKFLHALISRLIFDCAAWRQLSANPAFRYHAQIPRRFARELPFL